jgi:hypothetical protein
MSWRNICENKSRLLDGESALEGEPTRKNKGCCGSKTITKGEPMRPAAKKALLALGVIALLAILGGALALHFTSGLHEAFTKSVAWLNHNWIPVTAGAGGVLFGVLAIKFGPRISSRIVDALEKLGKKSGSNRRSALNEGYADADSHETQSQEHVLL